MLATQAIINPDDLYTVTAGGYSATADAFARDPDTEGLWFLSMVGPQTALKAIWASLLKQPPDPAFLIQGSEGMALTGGYRRCVVPPPTIGTWTTKIARLPTSGGWHALVYTRDGGIRLRAGLLPAAGPQRGGGPGPLPPLPGQAQPPAPAPLLGQLALAQGAAGRKHQAPPVDGRGRLLVRPRRRKAPR